MDQKLITALEVQLNLTTPDAAEDQEYILTADDEQRAIANEIKRQMDWVAWKMKDKGAMPFEVKAKMAATDWLSMIDTNCFLKQINANKHRLQVEKEMRLQEQDELQKAESELLSRCNAHYFFRLMKWTSKNVYDKELIINEHTTPLITTLCFFLSKDPRFETELGYDFKKGLLIRGISGLGKTHLIKCVENNDLNPVYMHSMIEITETLKKDGEYPMDFGGKRYIYLDDVGTEEPMVQHYGSKISFFKNFIEIFNLKARDYNRLIISTNCNFSEMEALYGFRVRSRTKAMFNTINVTGADMR